MVICIDVFVEKSGERFSKELEVSISVRELLEGMQESVSGVIVSVNDEVVLEDYMLEDGDFVAILSVVSGG